MPIKFYDIVAISVNNTELMAESARVQTENELRPIYAIGKNGTCNQLPNGSIKATFNINYYPVINQEPNYTQVNLIRNLVNSASLSGTKIRIAGITGYGCYLNSYTIQSTPNNLVKAAASYISFLPVSGQIQERTRSSESVDYIDLSTMTASGDYETLATMTVSGDWGSIDDPINLVYSGSPHGWTTYVSNSNNSLIAPTYDFSYNFNANWQPIYQLGKKYPSEVHLMNATEEMSFTRDNFTQIQFSGEAVTGQFITDDYTIDLYDLNVLVSQNASCLQFNVSGAKITSSEASVQLDDFVRTQTKIRKFY